MAITERLVHHAPHQHPGNQFDLAGQGSIDSESLSNPPASLRRRRGPRQPGLGRARQTLTSAESLLASDPANAFVLAYDSVRQACTALLAHQGLRPTISGGHVAVERAVRAQFGPPFAPYGGLRRRRNEVEYPAHPGEQVDLAEAAQALSSARQIIDAATQLIPHLGLFST